MPKLLMLGHVVLLLCLSLLAFRSSTGAPLWVSLVATALAAVLFFTEVLSGLRWPAVVAAIAAVVGLLGGWDRVGPQIGTVAWSVAWCAVVAWFALLALRARENR